MSERNPRTRQPGELRDYMICDDCGHRMEINIGDLLRMKSGTWPEHCEQVMRILTEDEVEKLGSIHKRAEKTA